MRAASRPALLALLAVLAAPGAAAARDGAATAPRARLPEPLVGESITDIDETESGELELESDLLALRQAGGARARGLDVEAEWRATRRLGIAVEAGAARSADGELELSQVEAGLAWSLLHDTVRGLHVQAEVSARLLEEKSGAEEAEGPLELPRPVSACLRAALRKGALTLRGAAGLAAGSGVSGFVQLALLRSSGDASARSFYGIEVGSNLGSGSPLWVVPQVFTSVAVLRHPVEVGLGLPWVPPLRGAQRATFGGLLRLIVPLDAD